MTTFSRCYTKYFIHTLSVNHSQKSYATIEYYHRFTDGKVKPQERQGSRSPRGLLWLLQSSGSFSLVRVYLIYLACCGYLLFHGVYSVALNRVKSHPYQKLTTTFFLYPIVKCLKHKWYPLSLCWVNDWMYDEWIKGGGQSLWEEGNGCLGN